MLGSMDQILAEAPRHLRSLIATNQAQLYPDGSIRYLALSGHPQGALAGWIRPAGEMVSQAASMIPQLNLALTAANTVITAVGFAVVWAKLNRIQRQLDMIDHRLARVETALDEVLDRLREMRGAIADLDEKVDRVRDAVLRESRLHKIAEIFAPQKSLEESIQGGRLEEIRRRIDRVSEGVHEATCLFGILPMEASRYRLALFRLSIVGRAMITRAYLTLGDEMYAVGAHREALRTARELLDGFSGPGGSFLGTAPTAYLLPGVKAVDPTQPASELSRDLRERILDYALAPRYPALSDGERLPTVTRSVPKDASALRESGWSVFLQSDRSTIPLTLEAAVGKVYRQPDRPFSLEEDGWGAVQMAYEMVAIERRLALENEILSLNPRVLRPADEKGKPVVVVVVDPDFAEERS